MPLPFPLPLAAGAGAAAAGAGWPIGIGIGVAGGAAWAGTMCGTEGGQYAAGGGRDLPGRQGGAEQ